MIGDAGGNIVEVQHQRLFGTASVKSPEVEFVLETRGREHAVGIERQLGERGVISTFI
jgi:threonine dehydratase